jgi:hypothetical protein
MAHFGLGAAASGQLGDGNVVGNSSPVQIGSLSDWAQVRWRQCSTPSQLKQTALSGLGVLMVKVRLGDGTTVTAKSSPVQIGALSNWAQVSAGSVLIP